MDINNILEEINSIFRRELDEDDIEIKYETVAKDVDGWDSLSQIHLVVSIEKHFKIRFTASEIQKFKNVGEMCEVILAKVNNA
jgi:acyl carrier protein